MSMRDSSLSGPRAYTQVQLLPGTDAASILLQSRLYDVDLLHLVMVGLPLDFSW